MTFHGASRDASTYRDNARVLGKRLFAWVVAPLFDQSTFPPAIYPGGRLRSERGAAAGRLESFKVVEALIARLRAQPDSPRTVGLIGHSAGGLFLLRMAAFDRAAAEADVIVAANPSGQVWPPLERRRAFVALPLVLLIGQRDGLAQKNRELFARAERLAADKGWPFCWRLIEVPGVGHDHRAMFAAEGAARALQHRCPATALRAAP